MVVTGVFQLASAYAETTIIPSASVTGRYDSNIFNRPASLLAPGEQLSDYRTLTVGAVQVLHETRDIEADFKIGGGYGAFVEHSERNFFIANAQGHLLLDRWVDRYVRGATLRVNENFRYTPEMPGFVSDLRARLEEDDSFLRGIQGFRTQTLVNTTSIDGSYPVSRDLSLEGGYTFGYRSVGRIQGGDLTGVSFFDTIKNTWHGGPRYQLTRTDSIAAFYRQSFITQSRAEGGRSFNTSLITIAGDYTKLFQDWAVSVEAGLTFVEPVGRTFPSGSLKIRTKPEKDTALVLEVSRQGRASFFLQGGATISNMGRIGVSHRIYERLTVDGGAAYAYNELFPNTDVTFKNFTAHSGLHYKLTRNIVGNLEYIFTHIDIDRPELAYQVSRHQVGITLTMEWK